MSWILLIWNNKKRTKYIRDRKTAILSTNIMENNRDINQ